MRMRRVLSVSIPVDKVRAKGEIDMSKFEISFQSPWIRFALAQ